MPGMVKIISGWSLPGGSTVSQINLCNLFNDNGIPCEFYGAHDWHTTQCNGFNYNKHPYNITSDDYAIIHYHKLPFQERPAVKTLVYSCRETDVMPLDTVANRHIFDYIHFVSNSQFEWHKARGVVIGENRKIIIPNQIYKFEKKEHIETGNAGVIGSIDSHKQTHLSIKRALESGRNHNKILLYGRITDLNYFNEFVFPLLSERVVYVGYGFDKQKMYDSIDCVYHSSKWETFNLIKFECLAAGIAYDGLDSAGTDGEWWSDEVILNKWKEVFGL